MHAATKTGAALVASCLDQLGVKVIFGLVGIPVVEIAEEAIKLGIRFIAFRNEQAASYAATAYGYLTGKSGVCLVVGGPGVLHAMAGIGNSSANGFPLLLIAGSCETHSVNKGAFQELDAISLLAPHTKAAIRATEHSIPQSLAHAYRIASYGRSGTAFVDVPADVINGESMPQSLIPVASPPRAGADPAQIAQVAGLIKSAKAPLIVIGKGAAFAQAEVTIRDLVAKTNIPFLPTPMGKGVLADSHTLNTSSARSTALKHADVVLVLGARLNWILHFAEDSKWNPSAQFIQVDSCPEVIGHNNLAHASLGLLGDINLITTQLTAALDLWSYDLSLPFFSQQIAPARTKNEAAAALKASKVVSAGDPLTYHRAFALIKDTLHSLSPPLDGSVVYISEGANTMDISRSVFPLEHPRLRMDAGTHATMGVGLGYAIAAHCAYNLPSETDTTANPVVDSSKDATTITTTQSTVTESPTCIPKRKKIVCLEGDSAFGFSLPEIETMARYGMDCLVFVINNSGIYRGDASSRTEWESLQHNTNTSAPASTSASASGNGAHALRSTSLGFEIHYELVAQMCGGKGYMVRTEDELLRATREGFEADVPVVVNVIIESGAAKGAKLEFAWQGKGKK